MEAMTTPTLGPGHTRADLDRMPDDGNRYELIEGEIVVAPSPRTRHQVVSARLFRLLDDARPVRMMVLYAPFDVMLEDRSVVEPDLVAFAHHEGADLPSYTSGGLSARLVAGSAFGAKANVQVHSPMFYVHWQLKAGTQAQLPAEYPERAAYVAQGEVEVLGQWFDEGKMIVFAPGQPVVFTATRDAIVMLLGGEPVGPRYIDWNFVSSSRERIEQAKADWRAGRMKLPDLDHDEFIPLPESPPPREPNPMS